MLRGTVAFLVLVACAVLGSELRRFLARRGFQTPALETFSFLVVGIALGDVGFGLFSPDHLRILRAVVLLGLAWIGLVFGLQVDLSVVRRLKPWHRWIGIALPTAVGAAVLAAAVLSGLSMPLAIGLSAVAAVPTASSMEGLARNRGASDRTARRLLTMVMAFAGIPAVFGFHAALGLWSPISSFGGGTVPAWNMLAITFGLGLVAGYVLVALIRGLKLSVQILTVLTGIAAAVAGAAAVLGLSPVTAAAVGGTVFTNRAVFPHRVLKVAHSLERPMLVALLVLVGASWTGLAFSWPVFLLMAPWRALAWLAAGAVLGRVARGRGAPLSVPAPGAGFLPQGELALGLLLALIGSAGNVAGVLEAVLCAFACNHLAGQWWLRRRLFPAVSPGEAWSP